ncbi:hypothetical protein WJX72_007954 [[Myrmecia] bisecta]|uniref:U-box domain-containing protein n=1 Tax=[Myrmecia] bisecta TaxID=41462 RepID=A0AAW1R835_9CHLO
MAAIVSHQPATATNVQDTLCTEAASALLVTKMTASPEVEIRSAGHLLLFRLLKKCTYLASASTAQLELCKRLLSPHSQCVRQLVDVLPSLEATPSPPGVPTKVSSEQQRAAAMALASLATLAEDPRSVALIRATPFVDGLRKWYSRHVAPADPKHVPTPLSEGEAPGGQVLLLYRRLPKDIWSTPANLFTAAHSDDAAPIQAALRSRGILNAVSLTVQSLLPPAGGTLLDVHQGHLEVLASKLRSLLTEEDYNDPELMPLFSWLAGATLGRSAYSHDWLLRKTTVEHYQLVAKALLAPDTGKALVNQQRMLASNSYLFNTLCQANPIQEYLQAMASLHLPEGSNSAAQKPLRMMHPAAACVRTLEMALDTVKRAQQGRGFSASARAERLRMMRLVGVLVPGLDWDMRHGELTQLLHKRKVGATLLALLRAPAGLVPLGADTRRSAEQLGAVLVQQEKQRAEAAAAALATEEAAKRASQATKSAKKKKKKESAQRVNVPSQAGLSSGPGLRSSQPSQRPIVTDPQNAIMDDSADSQTVDQLAEAHLSSRCTRLDMTQLMEDVCCPITQVVMQDPVIAADGHSYERTAIEEWLGKSRTSPMTGLELEHVGLIENRALRQLIEVYASKDGSLLMQ